MSERCVILHEEITSCQADTVSVVCSARTIFAISINLHVPLKKFLVDMGEESPRIRLKFWNSLLLEIMAKLMNMRGRRHTSRVRISMLFVVLPRWRSPGLSCRVSISQRLSTENDWRDRLCLSVFLTPLDLRNVNFQIFIPL